jgi:hypothetical protein
MARADGDPASDILLSTNVFISFLAPQASPEGRALLALTAAAKRQHFPIKVAVVTQSSDLGAVPSLFGKAQTYADFLGRELAAFYAYRGTLVVAMNGRPGGFGVHGPGATPRARQALKRLSIASPSTPALKLARLSTTAVERVAAANGHKLPPPRFTQPPSHRSSGTSGLEYFLLVLAGLVLLGIASIPLIRWLQHGSARP